MLFISQVVYITSKFVTDFKEEEKYTDIYRQSLPDIYNLQAN